MQEHWDIHRIKEILPQREPFLFIDRVLEVNKEKAEVVCLKNVTINDYFFEGHFPQNPIMPGAIIIEALAQASIIVFATHKPQIAEKHPNYYLGRVEARFFQPVRVGDRLILEAKGEKILNNAGVVNTLAKVEDKVVAKARISFAVEVKGTCQI